MAKTASYGIMHLCIATTVAYAVTGNWQMSLGIGLIEPAVQTVAYVLHERAWQKKRAKQSQTHPRHYAEPLCAA